MNEVKEPAVTEMANASKIENQFNIHTFTAVYDAVEDRIRLDTLDKAGNAQSIWLTRSLMDKLVRTIVRHLETNTPLGAPKEIVQSMTQEKVRQSRKDGAGRGASKPVSRTADMPSWLCHSIQIRQSPKGLVAILSDTVSVNAFLVLLEVNLRVVLDIFHMTYSKAGWSTHVFPEWLSANQSSSALRSGSKRLN